MSDAENKVEAYFARLPPSTRAIALALRQLVRKAAPKLTETLKWHKPCYLGDDIVCAIVTYRTHVNLAFWRGAELVGQDDLLEGTGKGIRHVKVQSTREI